MRDRPYDEPAIYDERAPVRRLSPAAPSVIWGALMVAALAGAGATIWLGRPPDERLVAAGGDASVRREVAKLSAERDELVGRLALLERGVGEVKLAMRAEAATATTGSIARPAPAPVAQPRARFGLSLGMETSPDAARRRWTALSARYPAQLASLAPRLQRGGERGQLYDLVAGPFTSRTEADSACGALADQGLACDTTDYVGDALPTTAR